VDDPTGQPVARHLPSEGPAAGVDEAPPGPSAAPGRRQRRTEELRDRVLDAAEAELAGAGLGGFSVDRVAQRADVALQTVYNRVGRRDALLRAVAVRAARRDRDYMDPVYDAYEGLEGQAAADAVLAAAHAYVRFALEQPEAFRLLADPPGPPYQAGADPTLDGAVADLVEAQNRRLSAALTQAVDAGVVRPLDADLHGTALWAMLNGLLALSWRADRLRPDPDQMRRLVEAGLDVLRCGLAPTPPTHRDH
jgi:AcrR family transcriptional regulator